MKLEATQRTPGRNGPLRREGRLPGVVYNDELNIPVAMSRKAFDKVFRAQGTSSLIDLDVEGTSHPVLVREVQMDKRKRIPMHVDFYAITAGQKLEVAIPVTFEGTAAGQKDGGELFISRREVTIYVLPREIPDAIELDIGEMQIGDSIHIGDVRSRLPETAEIVDDEELTLITIVPPRVEAEAEEGEEVTQPEVIGESADEDGEDASDEDG
ncbi:MAG: 50S ribosomal protein L25 [Trueperaceae bacterium]|nr:50S ribosomal protein L25 [Trueperaceae bacterium]